tara:strand:- start:444 stop:2204 length:1761 start_codon:yes stop_codon:yes gene_type:complete
MKISIIGPGLMPIPPKGWGAVESLIWDMANALKDLGQEVQIINTTDGNKVLSSINEFNPDFVHINYDDFIVLYPHITQPKAMTSHFGYLERPDMMNGYVNIFNKFQDMKPNVFCLSEGIKNIYRIFSNFPEDKLFVTPNGVNVDVFNFKEEPEYPHRSMYLAKVDYRKRQHLFQNIPTLWFAGNIVDERYDTKNNYLGEWSKEQLYKELTDYGNLVLLSDGEAHSLVIMEAFAAGLGVVISEYATANLDVDKEFITVIPEKKIKDIEYVEGQIIRNREYSIHHRQEILEYGKQFEWKKMLKEHYLPSVQKLIASQSKPEIPLYSGDKNKAAYKLKNFGPLYYINLDGQPERDVAMQSMCNYWELNPTRISAFDGRNSSLNHILEGNHDLGISSGEVGCVTSHLKAIKQWYETSDTPYAIFAEDDVSFDTARFWKFNWDEFMEKVPYDWDVIQLAIINPGVVYASMHARWVNDFSTACYMITRHHAKKLIEHHCVGDKFRLDQGVKPRPVADDLIYNCGRTYAIPLFHYKIELGSSIHPEHIEVFHKGSHKGILDHWREQLAQMEDQSQLFNYDPYLGRIPPECQDK